MRLAGNAESQEARPGGTNSTGGQAEDVVRDRLSRVVVSQGSMYAYA